MINIVTNEIQHFSLGQAMTNPNPNPNPNPDPDPDPDPDPNPDPLKVASAHGANPEEATQVAGD